MLRRLALPTKAACDAQLASCMCQKEACRAALSGWLAVGSDADGHLGDLAEGIVMAAGNPSTALLTAAHEDTRLAALLNLIKTAPISVVLAPAAVSAPSAGPSGVHGKLLSRPAVPVLRTARVPLAANVEDWLGATLLARWIALAKGSHHRGGVGASAEQVYTRVLRMLVGYAAAQRGGEPDSAEEDDEDEDAAEDDAGEDDEEDGSAEAPAFTVLDGEDADARLLYEAELSGCRISALCDALEGVFDLLAATTYEEIAVANLALKAAALFGTGAALLVPLVQTVDEAQSAAASTLRQRLLRACEAAYARHGVHRHRGRRAAKLRNFMPLSHILNNYPIEEALRFTCTAARCELMCMEAAWEALLRAQLAQATGDAPAEALLALPADERLRYAQLSAVLLVTSFPARPVSAIKGVVLGVTLTKGADRRLTLVFKSKGAPLRAEDMGTQVSNFVSVLAGVSAGVYGPGAFDAAVRLLVPLWPTGCGSLANCMRETHAAYTGQSLVPAGLRRMLTTALANKDALEAVAADLGVEGDTAEAVLLVAARGSQMAALAHGNAISMEAYFHAPATSEPIEVVDACAAAVAPPTEATRAAQARLLQGLADAELRFLAVGGVDAVALARAGSVYSQGGNYKMVQGARGAAPPALPSAGVVSTVVHECWAVGLLYPLAIDQFKRWYFIAARRLLRPLERAAAAVAAKALMALSDGAAAALDETYDQDATAAARAHLSSAAGMDAEELVAGLGAAATLHVAGAGKAGPPLVLVSPALVAGRVRDITCLPAVDAAAVREQLRAAARPVGGGADAKRAVSDRIMAAAAVFQDGNDRLGVAPVASLVDYVSGGCAVRDVQALCARMKAAQHPGAAGYVSGTQCLVVIRLLLAVCMRVKETLLLVGADPYDCARRASRLVTVTGLLNTAASLCSSDAAGSHRNAAATDGLVALFADGAQQRHAAFIAHVLGEMADYGATYGYELSPSRQAKELRAALLPYVAVCLAVLGTGWGNLSFVLEMELFTTVWPFRTDDGRLQFEVMPPFFKGAHADGPRRVMLCSTAQAMLAWLVATQPFATRLLFAGWPSTASTHAGRGKRSRDS